MTDELELAAVPAEDAAAPGHVTDDEFEQWVRRSQEQTDAALAGWDSSVAFEQRRYADGGMTMDVEVLEENGTRSDGTPCLPGDSDYRGSPERPEDVGLVEAVIYNEDGTVFEPPPPTPWQELARRIRAGEEIGAEFRQEILGSLNCEDPSCPVCAEHARAIDGIVPELPAWALEVAQRFMSQRPGERMIVSMPRSSGRSWVMEEISRLMAAGTMRLPESPWATFLEPGPMTWAPTVDVTFARRNLETMGFIVVDSTVQIPVTSLEQSVNRLGYFVSELEVQRSTAPATTLWLPGDEERRWARQEFGLRPPAISAVAPQRRATFRTLPWSIAR